VPKVGTAQRRGFVMTHATTLRFAALLFLSAPLVAQTTWVVDAANGPGTHFTDLPPAVLAAAHGDTLLVRAGTYNGCTVDKGLRLLGGPGVVVQGLSLGSTAALEVVGIPAGRELVVKGMTLQLSGLFGMVGLMRVTNCAGPVVIEDLVAEAPVQSPYPTSPTPPAVQIAGCAAVSLDRCRLRGSPGLRVADSTVAVGATTAAGIQGGKFIFSGLPIASSPALELARSTVLLTQPGAQGGDGFTLTIQPVGPSPAIRMNSGRLVVAGDGGSLLAAGSSGSILFSCSAVEASGDVLLDPDVRLTTAGAAPPITGGAAVVRARLPALTATGAAPGSNLTAALRSEPGHLELLLASSPIVPLATPVGQLWVSPFSFLVLDVGVQGASGRRVTSVPIPPDPSLRGLPIVLQALSGAAPTLGLSTPATVVLH
jgi:hypothetical protein